MGRCRRVQAFGRAAVGPRIEGRRAGAHVGVGIGTLAATERAPTLKAAQSSERRVWFSDGWHPTPVYARDRLPLDAVFEGPAILEQLDCTTVVEPGDKVRQDKLGNLLISVG
jgi:N-methylhydantoinase A